MVVSGDADSAEIMGRRRIVVTDPKVPSANQPYHYAENVGLPKAQNYLANCAAVSERLAVAALSEVVRELARRGVEL